MTIYTTREALKEMKFTVVEICRQDTPWSVARTGNHLMPPG